MEIGRLLQSDVRKLLENKKVIFLGDSIIRDVYKDMVWLYQKKGLIPYEKLADATDRDERDRPTVQRSLVEGEELKDGTGIKNPDMSKGQ